MNDRHLPTVLQRATAIADEASASGSLAEIVVSLGQLQWHLHFALALSDGLDRLAAAKRAGQELGLVRPAPASTSLPAN